jgi:hypothetical protein
VCFHGSAASFPFSFNAIEPPSLGFMVDATALLRNLLKKINKKCQQLCSDGLAAY